MPCLGLLEEEAPSLEVLQLDMPWLVDIHQGRPFSEEIWSSGWGCERGKIGGERLGGAERGEIVVGRCKRNFKEIKEKVKHSHKLGGKFLGSVNLSQLAQ